LGCGPVEGAGAGQAALCNGFGGWLGLCFALSSSKFFFGGGLLSILNVVSTWFNFLNKKIVEVSKAQKLKISKKKFYQKKRRNESLLKGQGFIEGFFVSLSNGSKYNYPYISILQKHCIGFHFISCKKKIGYH
jgi:hypothetical protein